MSLNNPEKEGETVTRPKLTDLFPPDSLRWKVQATNRDESKCMVVVYVDARDVMDRLDSAGVMWEDTYTLEHVQGGNWVYKCRLTIDGVTHEDVGDGEDAKSALSDSFKRAAVRHGVGRAFYSFPRTWLPYDKSRRRWVQGNDPTAPAWYIKQWREEVGRASANKPSTSPPPPPLASAPAATEEKTSDKRKKFNADLAKLKGSERVALETVADLASTYGDGTAYNEKGVAEWHINRYNEDNPLDPATYTVADMLSVGKIKLAYAEQMLKAVYVDEQT